MLLVAGLLVVAGVLVYLFVPRTVAAADEWRLRIAPVRPGGTVELEHPDGQVRTGGPTGPSRLTDTVVWWVGSGDEQETLVVGPTPREAGSIRLDTAVGIREARVVRIGWRRYHVGRLPGHLDVEELVAISGRGGIVAVAEDLAGGRPDPSGPG